MNKSKTLKHFASALAVGLFLFLAFGSDDDKSETSSTSSSSSTTKTRTCQRANARRIERTIKTGTCKVSTNHLNNKTL